MDNATPRPWRIDKKGFIMGNSTTSIHSVIDDVCISDEDKALIVRAVNAHEALVEACKYAVNHLNENCPKFDRIHTRIKLEQAIALAEGRESAV